MQGRPSFLMAASSVCEFQLRQLDGCIQSNLGDMAWKM